MKCTIVLATALAIAAGQSYIGRLDTIGGTTYDWWSNGQAVKSLAGSPGFGVHAVWMYSTATTGTDFPDRSIRYNFYNCTTHSWNWPDVDYMLSGVNVFDKRAGYGNIDADTNGIAIVAGNVSGTGGVGTVIAREAAPGVGIFEYAVDSGDLGQWPRIATGQNGTIHIFMISATYGLSYGRIAAGNWPNFDTLRQVDPSGGFPTQATAASKVSGKACIIWEVSTDVPEDGYMQTSTDNGETWTSSQQFLPPDAYGGDTVSSFHITSLYPWYDYEGRLHIVANVSPVVRDTVYIVPSQIWHYCPDNTPQWSRIHIASCRPEHMLASVGYNATYADRPSIGEGNDGRLYVAWEQFDSSNVEPTTSRLRAGVWASASTNNGATWGDGILLTARNTASHRFPCIIDRALAGDPYDTVCVLYLKDSIAGFFVQGEGPATPNPVICQFVPTHFNGVADTQRIQEAGMSKMTPTIVSRVLYLTEATSRKPQASSLLDISGRKVLALRAGANGVRTLPPGVYFVQAEGRGARASKVVIQR